VLLFSPSHFDAAAYDDETRRALLAVRTFFDDKGEEQLRREYGDASWYADFL
jgi:hypothetical protein